jgi:hypothetical protein
MKLRTLWSGCSTTPAANAAADVLNFVLLRLLLLALNGGYGSILVRKSAASCRK